MRGTSCVPTLNITDDSSPLSFKAAFHDTDTDILADIVARIVARMSVSMSVSWNAAFTAHTHAHTQCVPSFSPAKYHSVPLNKTSTLYTKVPPQLNSPRAYITCWLAGWLAYGARFVYNPLQSAASTRQWHSLLTIYIHVVLFADKCYNEQTRRRTATFTPIYHASKLYEQLSTVIFHCSPEVLFQRVTVISTVKVARTLCCAPEK